MTKAETARLLTLIAAFDRRTIGEADVEAWHLILHDHAAGDCAEAVKEFFTVSREWLMPADVHRLAVAIARRRRGQQRQAARAAQIAAENGGDTDSEPVMTGGPAVPLAIEAAPLNSRIELYQQGRREAVERRRAREEAERAVAEARAARAARRNEILTELQPLRQDATTGDA